MTDLLLAHDVGTTGAKTTLFDSSGALVASSFAPYATHRPGPGAEEQDPDDWWEAVCRGTRAVLSEHPDASGRIAAVGMCAMMNGCVLVDTTGAHVRPALIHADIRSAEAAQRIAAEVGWRRAYQLSGHRVAPYYTLAKLAWLSEHEPATMRRARWCVQAKDCLASRLTGVVGVTDPSDASLTGMLNMASGRWSDELIGAGRIERRLLPDIVPSTTVVGHVTQRAAAETGLLKGTPVVLGGGDGACATAGAGAVRPGDAYHYLGGTSWIASLSARYVPDPAARVSVLLGLAPGMYVTYGTVQTASAAVDWFRSAIGVGEREPGEDEHAALERLVAGSPPGANGLMFLPYLQGERAPIWDPHARGAFIGLTPAHTRADLARAVMEGVALALTSVLAVFEEKGAAPGAIRVLGGGMRYAVWRGILASAYNRPLHVLTRLLQATSSGAAMAAGVGVGLYPDLAAAGPLFAAVGSHEAPDPGTAALYARLAPFYRSLHPALAERFAALSALVP